jgi:hypothetical protein
MLLTSLSLSFLAQEVEIIPTSQVCGEDSGWQVCLKVTAQHLAYGKSSENSFDF